jgi:hypothetical protein
MLRVSGVFKITLRENLRGQLLWTSGISGFVLLLLMSTLSGSALTHESRIIDVFSYFISDQLLLLVGIFSGASLCSTDFSARGVSELYIPAGVSRHGLLLTRFMAYAIVLLFLASVLYLFKHTVLPFLADNPQQPSIATHLTMFLFSWLKGLTALSIATLLGSVARPLYAILGTLTLFSFGHLTSTFDSLLSSSTLEQAESQIGTVNAFFYSLLKIWNPNLLVVESLQGQWLAPTIESVTVGVLWAVGFIMVSLGLAIVRVNRIDIRA